MGENRWKKFECTKKLNTFISKIAILNNKSPKKTITIPLLGSNLQNNWSGNIYDPNIVSILKNNITNKTLYMTSNNEQRSKSEIQDKSRANMDLWWNKRKDQVLLRSGHRMLTGNTCRVLFVVIGKKKKSVENKM